MLAKLANRLQIGFELNLGTFATFLAKVAKVAKFESKMNRE